MEEKREQKSFKTHILLPIIFVLTLAVAIMFVAVKDFIVDMSPLVVWLYFGVVLAYTAVAIFDLFINKERSKKNKIFVIIMAVFVIVSAILYAIFYLIAKGNT